MGSRTTYSNEVESIAPTFSEDLEPSIVVSGEDQSWVIPDVIIGSAALAIIQVVPDLYLTDMIAYDAETKTVSFSDAKASKKLEEGFYMIKITLIDANDLQTEYTQQVIVEKLYSLESEEEENSTDASQFQEDPLPVEDPQPVEDKAEQPSGTFTATNTTSKPSQGLSTEATEFNLAIEKPWLDSIGFSGTVELQFTKLRMQRGNECIDLGQDDQTFFYDADGEVSRIYGSFEGNLTCGISLYIEPSEMSNPEKLKFKV